MNFGWDLPPGVSPNDPHLTGGDEPEIIIHEDRKTWETEDRDGFYWHHKGYWFAMDSNDAGEPNAPEGWSRRSPEDAVADLLEQIAEGYDGPEPYDVAGDR